MMRNWKKRLLALCLLLAMFVNVMSQLIVKAAVPTPTVTKKTLYVGYQNYTIKMKNLEKGSEVKYSSSNKKVATVTTKGVIKPVAAGKATITITVTKSKKVVSTSSIAVTVKNPYVWISNKIDTIKVGETYQFTGKTYGLSNTSVTWTSSNKKVATVNAKTGALKAVAEGTTTVTFKDKTSGKKSTCKVVVKKGETVDKNTLLQAYWQEIMKCVWEENLRGFGYNALYFNFIYLDDDDIPELLIKTKYSGYAEEFTLLSYRNGEVIEFGDSSPMGIYFSYVPKSSIFMYRGGGTNEECEEVIEMSNNFVTIASSTLDRGSIDMEEKYSIPGKKNASEKEYNQYLESRGFIGSKIESIDWEVGKNVSLNEAYNLLMRKSSTVDKQVKFSGKTVSKEKAEIGDTIKFGAYEQDNNISNGKEAIEWLVLDKQDGKLLLLSKYALVKKEYNEKWEEVTWETCTLRRWLNDEFYKMAFSGTEQKLIATTNVKNDNTITITFEDSFRNTPGGNDTKDKIFLLSIEEVLTYFSANSRESDPARRVQFTKYAGGYSCEWWLRSPGWWGTHAAVVTEDGQIDEDGDLDDAMGRSGVTFYVGVRPVMWINIEP